MLQRFVVLLGMVGMLMAAQVQAAVDIEYVWQQPRPHMAPDVTPVSDQDYRNECGACHFAYPPGFLPARSWQAVMGGLDKHFGENAEVAFGTLVKLQKYLLENAADSASTIGSRRLMKYMKPDETPLRLTDTTYIKLRHRNVPARLFNNNPELKGLSSCSGCHTRADSGYFNEREVRIPGPGRREE